MSNKTKQSHNTHSRAQLTEFSWEAQMQTANSNTLLTLFFSRILLQHKFEFQEHFINQRFVGLIFYFEYYFIYIIHVCVAPSMSI